jgi:hypothetical protein
VNINIQERFSGRLNIAQNKISPVGIVLAAPGINYIHLGSDIRLFNHQ